MRNQVYNAVHDFTDKDRVASDYRLLWANKFRQDIESAKQKDFRKSWKYAVMDMAVGILIMILVALIVCLPALLEN